MATAISTRATGAASSEVKLVADLSEDETQACLALTLTSGAMGPKLARIRSYMDPRVRNHWMLRALETDTVVMLREGGGLVAWALIQCANPRVQPKVYLYVAEGRRREGFGSRLVADVLQRWPGCQFCPWDDRSRAFFRAHPLLTAAEWREGLGGQEKLTAPSQLSPASR